MPRTFRQATEDDLLALNRIWSWTWSDAEPEKPEEPYRSLETPYLVEDGEIESVCVVIDFTMVRGGSTISCGGIGGVSTPPWQRGKGAAKDMMVGVLKQLNKQETAISALYAFDELFYRKLGYGSSGWMWKFRCPFEMAPRPCCHPIKAREIMPKDAVQISPAFERFVRQRSGSMLRTEETWKVRLGKKPKQLLAVGDPIHAYLWASVDNSGDAEALIIHECGYADHAAYRELWSLIHSMAANHPMVEWREPPDSFFQYQIRNRELSVNMAAPVMYRVTHVPEAMRQLDPPAGEPITVQINDSQIPENNGVWRLDGGSAVRSDDAPEAEMSIEAFSQIFVGAPSASLLHEMGAIKAEHGGVIDRLEALFPPMPVVCMDPF